MEAMSEPVDAARDTVVIVESRNRVVAALLSLMILAPLIVGLAGLLSSGIGIEASLDPKTRSVSFAASSSGFLPLAPLGLGIVLAFMFSRTVLMAAGLIKPIVGRTVKGQARLDVRVGVTKARRMVHLEPGTALMVEWLRQTRSAGSAQADETTLTELRLRTPTAVADAQLFGPFTEEHWGRLREWCGRAGVALSPPRLRDVPVAPPAKRRFGPALPDALTDALGD